MIFSCREDAEHASEMTAVISGAPALVSGETMIALP